jgi:superfamily II DNA or RNA helicase
MNEQGKQTGAADAGKWTEAEAFVLYWTQYFNAPIKVKDLQTLWQKPRVGKQIGPTDKLPFQSLIDRNLLDAENRDGDSYVSFRRAALTKDQMRRLLTLPDVYNWTFWTSSIISWCAKAFPASNGQFYSWKGERDARSALSRHVLYRHGLCAWSQFEKILAKMDSLSTDVNTTGDDSFIFQKLSAQKIRADKKCNSHSMLGVYVDIVKCPLGMSRDLASAYAAERTEPWTTAQHILLSDVARAEAVVLRTGQSHFDAQTEAEFVAILAAKDFLAGDSTTWAVARLNELRKRAPLTPWATNVLLGLAFWQRDFDTIKSVGVESPFCYAHKKTVASGLIHAAAHEYDAAGAELLSALCVTTFTGRRHWAPVDLPVMLVFTMCRMLAEKRTHGGLNRAREALHDCAVRLKSVKSYYSYSDREDLESAGWIEHFEHAVGGAFVDLSKRERLEMPSEMPFCYLRTLVLLFGNSDLQPMVQKTLDFARRLQTNGYPGIAADVAAALRRVTNGTNEEEKTEKTLAEIGVDPSAAFAASRTVRAPWETALDALEKTIGIPASAKGKSSKAAALRDEFHWAVRIVTGEGHPYVSRVFPCVFPRLKNGKLGTVKVVSEKSFLSGGIDELLTPEDLEIRSLLVGGGALLPDPYAHRYLPSVAALRKLAQRPGLLADVCSYDDYWSSKPQSDELECIEMDCAETKIEVRMTSDGAAEIVAPTSYRKLDGQVSYALVRDSAQQTVWHLCEFSKKYREVAQLIDSQTGGKNKLRIPGAGLDRLADVLSAAEGKVPIAWNKNLSSASNVPREAATCVPCVRLSFKDGVLTAALAVRLSAEPPWSAEPGKGLPERLVVRADKSRVLLTRDFAAEEKAVEPAHTALAPFEAAKAGEAAIWVFDGVEDALTALAVLHEASLNLEWPDGEALKLSSLVAHSAKIEGGETADYWLGVSGEFKLDDGKVLSFIDLLRSFDSREGSFVKLTEGRYLKLSAALARRVEALKAAGVERNGKILISPAALPSLEKAARETEADDLLPLPEVVRQRIETIRDAFGREFPEPRGFKCQMRPYQEEGYQWLSRLAACGIGACLADDMGLGKTIEVIALLASRKADGPSLVVVPASVTFNWRNEIARFAPNLRVALVGQAANVSADDEDVAALAASHDVVVTSYGVLTTREEKFAPVLWNVVALDEAQAIKNHNTHRAKSVKTLKAKFRVVATGTPIENRLSELWSIFDFINPGMLGGEVRFSRELAPHGLASPRLKRLVKPLILRRLKRDVLTDLPDKEEITVPVVLGDDERHAYEATRQNAVKRLEEGDSENKIAILAELTRLRRFCCHPSLVMPSMLASAKLDALEALLGDLKASGHRALVFSQFVDYLSIVRKMIERNGWTYQYLDGATSKSAREKAVEAFQSGTGDFFVISLKAGGMGLNLTAANYVILLDPWWNPAVENQATDRAHRIGQRLPVTVYRLIAQDTIEEKVVRLHEKKTALAEDVLADGASALSAKAMLELLEG